MKDFEVITEKEWENITSEYLIHEAIIPINALINKKGQGGYTNVPTHAPIPFISGVISKSRNVAETHEALIFTRKYEEEPQVECDHFQYIIQCTPGGIIRIGDAKNVIKSDFCPKCGEALN